jgi:hypothetical protein
VGLHQLGSRPAGQSRRQRTLSDHGRPELNGSDPVRSNFIDFHSCASYAVRTTLWVIRPGTQNIQPGQWNDYNCANQGVDAKYLTTNYVCKIRLGPHAPTVTATIRSSESSTRTSTLSLPTATDTISKTSRNVATSIQCVHVHWLSFEVILLLFFVVVK